MHSASQIEELNEKIAALNTQVGTLAAERDEVSREREEYKKLYLLLLEQNERLKRGLLGQKAERLPKNDAQLSLSILEMMLGTEPNFDDEATDDGETEAVVEQEVKAHTRRKPTGRKPLPEHLPHVSVEMIPLEVQRQGLDNFERIGVETAQTLERRPASMVVVEVHRPKFVRTDRKKHAPTTVFVSEPPELPIPKGLAGPGLLADTIVRRWQDHLPLNRLEDIFAREGVELSRSTMCGWHMQLAELVRPVVEAMHRDVLMQPYLCTDATGVLVQDKHKCRSGHFWVVVAPGLHVLYGYTPRHDGDGVDKMLGGYAGYVVADAHAVYDHLYGEGDDKATEVGCWAHARRYFFKALESDPERARAALSMIATLFTIERAIATAPRKKRESVRQKKAAPIVDRFFEWCEAEALTVLDHTPISAGVRYARNQEQALRRFLEDGRLPIHNNISELHLRREAVGRKNWLFVGSDDGGETNALFVSLLASCRMHGIEPWSYLRDLLVLLPWWKKSRVLELAPAHWKKTLEYPDTQEVLRANPFRAALLELDKHHRDGS